MVTMDTSVESVTVYPDRARVTRRGSLELEAGSHRIVIDNLPAAIVPESLRVSGRGSAGARLLSVRSERVFLKHPAEVRTAELEAALEERNKNLRIAYLKMKKDLEAAAKMQQNLLPKSPPEAPNARLAWLLQPSSFVAGDIFNVFRLNEEHLGLYILDVSGHGVPAAMLSVTLSKLLSPLPGRDHLLKKFIPNPPHYELASCSEVAMKLNQSFQQETNDDMYFTMIYAKMNYHTGQLRWVQAGHPPPIHIPKGKKPRTIGEGGYPIGLIPDADYQEEKIDLKKGDRLFFYSDGVTETANERGELFSQERLCDLLKSLEEKPLTENPPAILKELKAWRGGKNDFEDDVTMILLEFDPK